jgi:hypothetical protein
MGDGRIFPKNLRASLFNEDLPNFGWIHLAGQYLSAQYLHFVLPPCPVILLKTDINSNGQLSHFVKKSLYTPAAAVPPPLQPMLRKGLLLPPV